MSIEADQSKAVLLDELRRLARLTTNPRRELTKSQPLLARVHDALGQPELSLTQQADALTQILNDCLGAARADVLALKQGARIDDPDHARQVAAAGEFLYLTDEEAFRKNFAQRSEDGTPILNKVRLQEYQSKVKGRDPILRQVRAERAGVWLERSARTSERREELCLGALAYELDTLLQDSGRVATIREVLRLDEPLFEKNGPSTDTTIRRQSVEELDEPSAKPKRNRLRRALTWASSIALVITLLGVWVTNGGYHWAWVWIYRLNHAATCSDIGNRDRATPEPLWSGPFRAAYKRAGSQAMLGCPRTDDPSGYVHLWAAGWSQDLQGGRVGIARIMALDPQHVIVMAGSYWHDYTDQGNGQPNSDAAQQKGYPTSNPVPCGPARLVLLAQSQEGESPGAMVTDTHHAHFIWLPKLIWMRYRATGGPFGRLGLPLDQEQSTPAGQLQRFQHGYILLTAGTVRTNLEQAGHVEPTSPYAVARLAGCIALTRR